MCGVTTTLPIVSSGLSLGVGSCSNTSSAAPAISPSRRARINAASSTTPPRQVLMTTAVGFIILSSRVPIMPRV